MPQHTRLYTVKSRRYEGSFFGIYHWVYIPHFSKFSFFIINFFAASRQPSAHGSYHSTIMVLHKKKHHHLSLQWIARYSLSTSPSSVPSSSAIPALQQIFPLCCLPSSSNPLASLFKISIDLFFRRVTNVDVASFRERSCTEPMSNKLMGILFQRVHKTLFTRNFLQF